MLTFTFMLFPWWGFSAKTIGKAYRVCFGIGYIECKYDKDESKAG